MGTPELSSHDQAILDLAGRWYRYAGTREVAIRDEVGMSRTRFHQQLNALLDDERAVAYAPMTVNRLRRERDRRRAGRTLAPTG